MGDAHDPHLQLERPSDYGPPTQTGTHIMPSAETAVLHSYPHPSHPGAAMPPHWNPTPSPYNEGGGDHRHQHPESHPGHQHPYPPPHYDPPPPSGHPADPAYSRQGSSSAPARSPPNVQPSQYPPHPPAVNGNPPPNHYYQQPPPEYRDRPAYGPPEPQSNGTQPPPLHVTTNHGMMPGHPQSAPPMAYGPQSAGPPSTPYPPSWAPGGYDSYPRRKPVRAAQACDPCRQRKAKCDEGRPMCTHCKDNNLTCSYRDIPPQKNEKHALAIQDKLDSLTSHVERILDQTKAQDAKIDRLINFSESQSHRIAALESGTPNTKHMTGDGTPALKANSLHTDADSIGGPSPKFEGLSSHVLKGLPEKPRDQGLPEDRKIGNSPAAANLLAWPVIKKLIPSDHNSSYIMDTESTRGLLRLHGAGEGEDKSDGLDGSSSPATSSSSGRHEEDSMITSSSGVWGTGQFPPPTTTSNGMREHTGGLGPYGGLLLDADLVDKYHQSYLANMYKLHPFLEKQVLRKMIHAFKAKYSWDFKGNYRSVSGIGIKRKREGSDSPNSVPDEFSTNLNRPRPRHSPPIEHSITNAIILLVMALGKICAHREPLQGPVQPTATRTSSLPTVYSDLPMTTSASAPTSPFTGQINGNGGFATPSHGNIQTRNVDVMPGLAYFTKAANILGEMAGGVDVVHVQANLLAGLYMGQLGRILPSHWFIRNACTACQTLINSPPYKEEKISLARRNVINFAFWSCLQLESDLLAEMELPPSGIVAKEGEMAYEKPTQLTLHDAEGVDSNSVIEEHRHYSYQITLRKILNDSLQHIYRENRDGNLPSKSVISAFGAILKGFRTVLGSWDWDDDDHETEDINVARLRGKYYGAKYIIHRPALYYALNFGTKAINPMHRHSESPATIGSGSDIHSPAMQHQYEGPKRHGEMRPPPLKHYEPLEPWVLEASQTCIHAAIRSTTAFDGVPRRMVITNIFGTAHAQFGNCLVLAATFCSQQPQLRALVEESTLRFLLDRTIKFLQLHEAISPSLGKDAIILQHVQNRIFNVPIYPSSAASSFSSSR